ncbi:hypothetical protein E0Z10_g10521 [Xylaria hypoxylon]|uniref:Ankyrin repeat protein n=1 Tax=Xylaria hypoxylon TaxID=37992 RepID=A0A4Z0YG66_9PEZI|nr:hypothetical protein E0Z10_g10521 [Xylaria hypoxylon]
MGNNSATSCLSAEPHNDAIKDPLIHYFGCMQFCDRDKLLNPKDKIWIDEETHQTKFETARNTPKAEIDTKVKEKVDAIRERWGNNFDNELRRIESLRKTLAADDADKHLVQEVNECRGRWQNCSACRKGIAKTQKPPKLNDVGAENDAAVNPDSSKNGYELEKDVSVGIIQFEEGEPFNENCDLFNETCDSFNNKKGLIWGKFPDQKTSVHSLLCEGNNPDRNLLHKDRIRNNPGRIRYFHIPSNNMIWAEEAISKYFGEDRPDFASFRRQLGRGDQTRSSIILQDRYWRGQLHGDEKGPSHAKYMSPMPYLHWETSKKRGYFASEMDKIITADSDKKKNEEKKKRSTRIKQRKRPEAVDKESEAQQNPTRLAEAYNRARTRLQTLRTTTRPVGKALEIDIQNDTGSRQNFISRVAFAAIKLPRFKIEAPLAKYLMAVSKLYEGMANYRDKMLLRKYLTGNPPLHPRRTLDQAFYWTLRTTKERDCDQVVFRGTTTKPDDFHRFDLETQKWPKHEEFKTQGICPDCTVNIQRRPEVMNEFSRAIGNIMHEQSVASDRLWWWTEQAKMVYCTKGYTDTSNLHMTLLDINPEGHLDQEIEDILDELDIMLHFANTQNDILKKFVEQAERILNPNGEFKERNGSQQQIRAEPDSSLSGAEKEREKAYRCFKQKANEGQARTVDYIRELKELRESAKKTADDVLHLLSMKQQQASVFQAWQAMKQSNETIKQGRSIMAFTLVTIVFLPLSFLSSVFGMNNPEFGNDNWSISRQIIYIWLYDFYLERPTKRIYEDAAKRIYVLKRDRRKEYFERKGERRLETEQRHNKRPEAEAEQQPRVGKLACFVNWALSRRWTYWFRSDREKGDVPPGVLENGKLPGKSTRAQDP